VDRGRVGVFIGYSKTTNKQFKFYSPELGYTSRSSRISVDEYTPGGKVELRLRNIPAGPQGTQNMMPDRKPRGRPRKDPGTNTGTNTENSQRPTPARLAELIETSPAESKESPPAEPIEPSPAGAMELCPAEPTESPPAEPIEPSPAEAIEPSPTEPNTKPTKRGRGRPRKVTAIPPTALSQDERVPDLVNEEPREPVKVLLEAPRYFTRGSKRKRSSGDTVEDERFRKIIKAMLAQVDFTDE
jgi:hypothetical protein